MKSQNNKRGPKKKKPSSGWYYRIKIKSRKIVKERGYFLPDGGIKRIVYDETEYSRPILHPRGVKKYVRRSKGAARRLLAKYIIKQAEQHEEVAQKHIDHANQIREEAKNILRGSPDENNIP